jgi:hypothetical protein
MKRLKDFSGIFKIFFIATIAGLLTGIPLHAQEQITVPLSNPGQPGELSLSMIRGGIHVSGHDGREVVIRYDNDRVVRPARAETRDGLRRISGSSQGFEIQENNNNVEIGSVSPAGEINFEILVPRNFSLKLSIIHGDRFVVENVNGDLDINHVNGEVSLINIGGSALVNTVNGNISASFQNVTEDKPMAFSNVNGDIDVTLPASVKMTAKMKSEWGDVFTDFDMQMIQNDNTNQDRSESGSFKISVNNWRFGEINGGGPTYMFKTLHGDIFIRKR